MSRIRSQWEDITAADPTHSQRYIQRFKDMAANGADLHGEARMIDAMVGRGSRILDAGCGPGRVGGELHRRGHVVVGVDIDPVLIEAAERDEPGPRWLVGDLADLPDVGGPLDAIVCAGNVMTFCAAPTRVAVLRGFQRNLAAEGRAVVGFGAGRGYDFAEFVSDADAAGLVPDIMLSTWDLRPFTVDSGFLVAVLQRA